MRKRILPFALALVMVFTLSACSSAINSVNRSVREGQQKLASVENCHLVLQLTINPQLVLYLDEGGIVLKADAGNKDGERLLEGLELSGLSYEDAVNAVLTTAAEQNLLPENAKVQIDVLASAAGPLSPEQIQQLEQAVTDCGEQQAASVDQSVVVAENCGANNVQVEHMENGDVFYSYFSNMERIREICYGADGSYHEWVYENKQTVSSITVNADGTRYEEHCSYEDGQMVYHSIQSPSGLEEDTYEDGQMVYHSIQSPSGLEETTYYSDGTQKSHKVIGNDGSFSEQYFDENGIITYSYDANDDRNIEQYYYANGQVKTYLVTYSDGSVQERYYHENGATKYSRDVSPDGSVQEEHYDEAGNRIED